MAWRRDVPLAFAVALAFGLSASARPTRASAQSAENNSPEAAEAARGLFREGADLANQGRWEEARERFRRALAVHPSPLLRFNLALAAQNSGHFVEALDQYRQFLRDDTDPANAIRRQDTQTAIETITPVLARVTVTTTGTDRLVHWSLDGRTLPPALLGVEVPVDPGEHVLEAEGEHGAIARTSVTLGEGAQRSVTLALTAPVATRGVLPPVRRSRPTGPPRAAPQGTIERVRLAVEAKARTPDLFGRRRWERTLVFQIIQGTGTPVGLAGAGLRWAARPFFEIELDAGAGHPFGPGVAQFVSLRYPWSYRYGLGLTLGYATNFTDVRRGEATCATASGASAPFTPVWLMAAVTHEWRASSPGVAFRLALGARYLFNHSELANTVRAQCGTVRSEPEPVEYLFDRPTLDHAAVPVLPYAAFDVGYAL